MKYAAVLVVLLFGSPHGGQAKDLVFVGQDYPPFNWAEGNEVKGGMAEVMKKACEKLRYNCKFSIVPLARAIKMLEDGSADGGADGVMSLIPNAERGAFATFSPTLVVSTLAYFGSKGKVKKVGSLKELDGWTVGVARASTSSKMVLEHKKQVPTLTVVEEVTNETMVKKLQGDRYGDKGAIFGGDAILEYEAKQAKLEIDMILSGGAQNFTTAFSKKSVDAQTFTALTQTLEGMKKSGEVKAILDKFGLKTD
ncbi:MAG: transporter substrate-binding domain-containing protein [Rhodoferax sp.]|nr:transporter substrate-binding domain-containing protein [Rhodoferax sp.]MDP3653433.1 transporter substrate-binding domain-containing protein [Rhodoferax sp.]